jgi:glucose-1-phosphate adenylyltransferase
MYRRTARWPRPIRDSSASSSRTYALVLAGKSRLRNLTDWRAKPAVPFGGKFRIIDFVLSNCVNSGVRRIGVATQYKAHSLIRHIQRGWSFLDGRFDEFVDVLPASQRLDDAWYAGTADAVYQNLDILRAIAPKHVLILGGDHIYKMDYGRLLSDHVRNGAELTVACIEVPLAEATAFGVMGVDADMRVREFVEKPEHPQCVPGKPGVALASMGIYVFDTQFLFDQLERDTHAEGSSHDFGKDIIPYLVPRNRVFAHDFRDSCVGPSDVAPYWRDVGTVDAYWAANLDLASVDPELNLYDREWPIWTWQEQLPPAKFVFDEDDRRGAAVDSLVSGGCIVSGSLITRSVLYSNVRVHSFGGIEDSVLLPEVVVNRGVKLRKCVVDKRCVLPAGLEVGFDPVEDAKHFHVTEEGVTLITPDMLGQPVFHQR